MTAIESWLREILRCPSCRSTLRDATGPGGQPELACTGCSLAYRIDDGIPVLLVEEARDRDADGAAAGAAAGVANGAGAAGETPTADTASGGASIAEAPAGQDGPGGGPEQSGQ